MAADRDDVISALSRRPADASLEDIRYEFETIFGILEGMRDFAEGRTHSHEEVMEMARQCLSKRTGRTAPAGT
jgi:predicted transcriptional regulator